MKFTNIRENACLKSRNTVDYTKYLTLHSTIKIELNAIRLNGSTYKIPTINRSRISTVAFGENADKKALIRAHVEVSRMTF